MSIEKENVREKIAAAQNGQVINGEVLPKIGNVFVRNGNRNADTSPLEPINNETRLGINRY